MEKLVSQKGFADIKSRNKCSHINHSFNNSDYKVNTHNSSFNSRIRGDVSRRSKEMLTKSLRKNTKPKEFYKDFR